jgi:hypothetical protein
VSLPRKPKRTNSALKSRREVIRQLVALPAAFSIVPLSLGGRLTAHEHVVGMAAQHPCPTDWTFVGEMGVNGKKMCVYRDAGGGLHAIQCPV